MFDAKCSCNHSARNTLHFLMIAILNNLRPQLKGFNLKVEIYNINILHGSLIFADNSTVYVHDRDREMILLIAF